MIILHFTQILYNLIKEWFCLGFKDGLNDRKNWNEIWLFWQCLMGWGTYRLEFPYLSASGCTLINHPIQFIILCCNCIVRLKIIYRKVYVSTCTTYRERVMDSRGPPSLSTYIEARDNDALHNGDLWFFVLFIFIHWIVIELQVWYKNVCVLCRQIADLRDNLRDCEFYIFFTFGAMD